MNEPLRGCPVCGTRVADVDLGLRDYRWLGDTLPGKIAPMDIDFMLEKNGRFLVMEYKPKGAGIAMGQRLTLKRLVRLGMDVWLVWDIDGSHVDVGVMDRNGVVAFVEKRMTIGKLRRKVSEWLDAAFEEED